MEKTYLVYKHTTPNGEFYIGITSDIYSRFSHYGKNYIGTSLEKYILQYGWENIKHEVIKDGLTEEEARRLEGKLIDEYKKTNSKIINERRSGLFRKNKSNGRNYTGVNPKFKQLIEENNLTAETNVKLRTACENLLYKQAILDFLKENDSSVLQNLESAVEALKTYKNETLCEMLGKKCKNTEYPFKNITTKKLQGILKETRFSTIKSEKQNDKELIIAYINKFPNLSIRKMMKQLKEIGVSVSKSTLQRIMCDVRNEKELELNSLKTSAYINKSNYQVREQEVIYQRTVNTNKHINQRSVDHCN